MISQTSIINSTTEIATISKYTVEPKNDEIPPQTTNMMKYSDIFSTSIESLQTDNSSTLISIMTVGNSSATSMKVGLENTTITSTTSTFKTTYDTGNSIGCILSI